MDCSKSCDIYNISTKILKISSPLITPILCKLFNNSFKTGVFPTKDMFINIRPFSEEMLQIQLVVLFIICRASFLKGTN